MNLKRTKYKRTTPKSHSEYSSLDISLGDGFKHLLIAVARIIDKYFGLLYMFMSMRCTFRADYGNSGKNHRTIG